MRTHIIICVRFLKVCLFVFFRCFVIVSVVDVDVVVVVVVVI